MSASPSAIRERVGAVIGASRHDRGIADGGLDLKRNLQGFTTELGAMGPGPAGFGYAVAAGRAGDTVTYIVTAQTRSAAEIARELEWARRVSGR